MLGKLFQLSFLLTDINISITLIVKCRKYSFKNWWNKFCLQESQFKTVCKKMIWIKTKQNWNFLKIHEIKKNLFTKNISITKIKS